MNKLYTLLIVVMFFAGCVTTNDRLSEVRNLSNTVPARRKMVLKDIRVIEKFKGRGDCAIEVLRVEDGGVELLGFVEYWTVQSCGVKTVYKLRKVPLGGGSFKHTVTYPSAAELKIMKLRRDEGKKEK